MKKINIIVLLSLLFLSNCKNPKKEEFSEQIKTIDSVNNIESKKENIINKDEVLVHKNLENCNKTFEEFFEKFTNDSLFQKERIQFPLKRTYTFNDDGIDSVIIKNISLDLYKFIDFSVDKNAWKKELNAYNIEIEAKDSMATYKLRGIDNGIYEDYKFILIKDCWYLVLISNSST